MNNYHNTKIIAFQTCQKDYERIETKIKAKTSKGQDQVKTKMRPVQVPHCIALSQGNAVKACKERGFLMVILVLPINRQ